MTAPQTYDIVVIGSGPGGEGAAMKASKAQKRVATIERYAKVGGGCTHWATIPSKALRESIQKLTEYNHSPLFRALGDRLIPQFADIVRSAQSVIAQQTEMRELFYERNHVRLIEGRARFVDPHTIEVQQERGASELIRAEHVVIATGSRPYHPDDVDFKHPRVRDSDTVLQMDFTPGTMTIYGAGVVGCEYASIFRNLGVKVNLIDTRDKLLSFLDDEISDALSYHLRDQGVLIRHNEEYERVEARPEGVILHCKSGKKIRSDVLLWANGRTGNSADLELTKIGITPDGRGQIPVNADHQTALPHIYAVGDVIGWPSLASAAYNQGRFAATHIVDGHCDYRLVRDIPTGIYTSPEISSLGRTERELTQQKIPYEIGQALFKSLARAQISGQTAGMLKILFHRDTLELLGIHCFGYQASEIVHIGQAIMAQEGKANTLMYFVHTTFNYPTMAEAYRVAALNGLNRLF